MTEEELEQVRAYDREWKRKRREETEFVEKEREADRKYRKGLSDEKKAKQKERRIKWENDNEEILREKRRARWEEKRARLPPKPPRPTLSVAERKAKQNAKLRAWRAKNPDKQRIINLRCRQNETEERKAARIAKLRVYQERNADHIKARRRAHYPKNKDRVRLTTSLYRKTNVGRYVSYKMGAKTRGYSFPLSIDEFTHFIKQPCYLCGADPSAARGGLMGIDRYDNSIGYEPSNCRPACVDCNVAKLDHTFGDFIALCHAIANKHPMQ